MRQWLSQTIWRWRSNDKLFKRGRGLGTKNRRVWRGLCARKCVNKDNEEDDDDDDDDDDDAGDENEGTSNKETEKDEENTNGDTDNEDFEPWNKLREVITDLKPFWEEQVEENLRQGLPKDDAQAQASSLLPAVAAKKNRHTFTISKVVPWP